MTFTRALSTNNYGPAKFIVSANTFEGTHTTIASALTSASSGDTIFIRPGTYTEENLTLKSGVNLTAYPCDAEDGQVIILGKCTATFSGTSDLSGIQFKTNSDYCISVTGSSATILNFNGCYINANNNTAIEFTSSNPSSRINIKNSGGDLKTTGIGLFASTSAGTLRVFCSSIDNTGLSTTASTASAGTISYLFSRISFVTTSSGTAGLDARFVDFEGSSITTPVFIAGGSGAHKIRNSYFSTGSGTSITATSTVEVNTTVVDSNNSSIINGAGTLLYSNISAPSASIITASTQTAAYTLQGKYQAKGQPSFLAYLDTTVTNVTGDGTEYTVIYDTEVFDQGNDFNLGTSTFTAPVDGRYLICASGNLSGGTVMTAIFCRIRTSNRVYRFSLPLNAGITTSASACSSVIADMDAADTFTITLLSTDSGGKIDDASGTTGGELRNWVSAQLIA